MNATTRLTSRAAAVTATIVLGLSGALTAPAHAALRVNARQGVEAALDRTEHGRQRGAPALHNGGDVAAQRHGGQEHERKRERDLRPADRGHDAVP